MLFPIVHGDTLNVTSPLLADGSAAAAGIERPGSQRKHFVRIADYQLYSHPFSPKFDLTKTL